MRCQITGKLKTAIRKVTVTTETTINSRKIRITITNMPTKTVGNHRLPETLSINTITKDHITSHAKLTGITRDQADIKTLVRAAPSKQSRRRIRSRTSSSIVTWTIKAISSRPSIFGRISRDRPPRTTVGRSLGIRGRTPGATPSPGRLPSPGITAQNLID